MAPGGGSGDWCGGVARLLVEALAKDEALGGGSGGLVWAEAQGRLN